MRVAQVVLLVLHLIGVVVLLVGLVVQLRRTHRRVTGPVRDGAATVFGSGLLLVMVLEARDQSFDHRSVAVMFGIGLVLLVLVMGNTRADRVAAWLYWVIVALTVGDVAVAGLA
jgi:cell division protein FtsW (lipid II flippase)